MANKQMNQPYQTFIPKGGMCASCKHSLKNCGDKDFASMPRIGVTDFNIVVVKCTDWESKSKIGDLSEDWEGRN